MIIEYLVLRTNKKAVEDTLFNQSLNKSNLSKTLFFNE